MEEIFGAECEYDINPKHMRGYFWDDKCQNVRAIVEAEKLRSMLDAPTVAKRVPRPTRRMEQSATQYYHNIAANWGAPFWRALEVGGEGSSKRRSNLAVRVEDSINASRNILTLGDNWDEEGSPGYAEATWKRATDFVRNVALLFINEHKRPIEPPKITPGPDGSIDIRWKAAKRTLLINFPAKESEFADFFGSDKGSDTIKGTLDLSSQNLWLLMWLTR